MVNIPRNKLRVGHMFTAAIYDLTKVNGIIYGAIMGAAANSGIKRNNINIAPSLVILNSITT